MFDGQNFMFIEATRGRVAMLLMTFICILYTIDCLICPVYIQNQIYPME